MQEFFFFKSTKNEDKNFEREKERKITLCVWENYVQNEIESCKFIARGGE